MAPISSSKKTTTTATTVDAKLLLRASHRTKKIHFLKTTSTTSSSISSVLSASPFLGESSLASSALPPSSSSSLLLALALALALALTVLLSRSVLLSATEVLPGRPLSSSVSRLGSSTTAISTTSTTSTSTSSRGGSCITTATRRGYSNTRTRLSRGIASRIPVLHTNLYIRRTRRFSNAKSGFLANIDSSGTQLLPMRTYYYCQAKGLRYCPGASFRRITRLRNHIFPIKGGGDTGVGVGAARGTDTHARNDKQALGENKERHGKNENHQETKEISSKLKDDGCHDYTNDLGGSKDTMKHVLMVLKRACDSLSPLVKCIYLAQRNSSQYPGIVQQKKDESMFTIADGLVQELLLRRLFKAVHFKAVVAEEDVSCNISTPPFSVGGLQIPDTSQISENIQKACLQLDTYAKELEAIQNRSGLLRSMTVFLDPIDGTKEFVNQKGECCTICVGFSLDGKADAGIVYRPLSETTTWAAGCAREGYYSSKLNESSRDELSLDQDGIGMVGPRAVSPFLQKLIDKTQARWLPVGGCGHKVLMLLEIPNLWYILDRGLSRWDTCAAQAVLEAAGCGRLAKLTSYHRGVIENQRETKAAGAEEVLDQDVAMIMPEDYTYKKTKVNLDWNPKALLTRFNSREKFAQGARANKVEDLNPYANVCGVVAHSNVSRAQWLKMVKAIRASAAEASPSYT